MSYCKMESFLSAYLDDELSKEEKEKLENHLSQCVSCRQELEDLRFVVQAVRQMPEIPLPDGFEEALQSRLASEKISAVPSFVPKPQSAMQKRWFLSRRFIGIAATVMLCFSISLIGKHINIGYEHLANKQLYTGLSADAENFRSKSENSFEKEHLTAVAGNQYNAGIPTNLTGGSGVREDTDYVPSPSRGDERICPYAVMASALNNLPEGLNNNNSDIPSQGLAAAAEEDGVEADSAEMQKISIAESVAANEDLQEKAKISYLSAQDASSWEIYNGYISLLTADVDYAREEVCTVASRYNGFMVEESVKQEEDTETVRLEIRVEKDYLKQAIADISALGEVTAKSVRRIDLSEKYYDAQGRLTRQRALEQSLLRLIAQSDDLTSIQTMENELEKVTAEIEEIIGNLEKISNQRKYSSIIVTLATDPIIVQSSATIIDKFQMGLNSFVGFCKTFPNNFIVGFGFMFEILAVLIILLILFYLVLHRFFRKPSSMDSTQK